MGGYLAYTEYKNSGVEWLSEIPYSWNPIPLKFLVTTRKGVAFKSSDFIDTGCKVVKASDIKNNTILDSSFFIDESFRSIVPKAILKEGEIVISTVGSTPDVRNSAVGQVGVVPKYLNGSLLNQNTVVFSPISSNFIENKFLFYILISTPYRDHLDLHAHGTANQASLNITDMLNFQLALPSIEEQRSIARFLDYKTAQIDALIAKKEALLEKLAEKRTALISQAVTKGCDPSVPMKDSGVEWIGEIPTHWQVIPLRYACEFLNRKRIPLSAEERGSMIERTYPYYGASGIIDYVENFIFEEPTILIAEDGANLLSRSTPLAFIAKGQYWVNNHAHILKPLKGPFEYWASLLCVIEYDPWITGAAQPKLTKENLGGLHLPFPPKQEQEQICHYISMQSAKIDPMIEKVRQAIAKLKEYRTALITNAVTGKIDVRDIKLPELDSVEAA